MRIRNLIMLAIVVAFSFSCSKEDDNDNNNNNNTTQPGPKFTEVKNIVNSSCAVSGCHVSPVDPSGINLQTDNNIVTHRAKIKEMAVDLDLMPPGNPLPQSQQDKITAWIEAGGRISD